MSQPQIKMISQCKFQSILSVRFKNDDKKIKIFLHHENNCGKIHPLSYQNKLIPKKLPITVFVTIFQGKGLQLKATVN